MVCCGGSISMAMYRITALDGSKWSILCGEWVSNGPRPLDEDIWTVGGQSDVGVVLVDGMWCIFECIVHAQ